MRSQKPGGLRYISIAGLVATWLVVAIPGSSAASNRVQFGVENGDCADLACSGLAYPVVGSPNPFAVDFGVQPTLASRIFVEFKARIAETHQLPYDFVSLVAVNDLFGVAIQDPSDNPWAWRVNTPRIAGADYQWYSFWFPADENGDGIVDWTAGENDLYTVTWSAYNPGPSISAWDTMIVSLDYDGNGVPDYRDTDSYRALWVSRYNGPGEVDYYNDVAHATTISPDGSRLFVTGYSSGADGMQFATVAYATATGAQLWVGRAKGPGHSIDEGPSLAVSADGTRLFVAGYSAEPYSSNFVTIAYDAATGARLWLRRYNGPANSVDEATAIAVSPNGTAVFVTGKSQGLRSGLDFATVGYAASSGATLWVKRYNGLGNGDDQARSIGVTANGSTVVITGYGPGRTSSWGYETVAYATANGAQRWVRWYTGPSGVGGDQYNNTLVISPDGSRVYVAGQGTGKTSTIDFVSIAYDVPSGRQLWVSRYNNPDPGAFDDFGRALALSPDGSRLYVTGDTVGGLTPYAHYDFQTVAYDTSNGSLVWASTWNSPTSGRESASAIGVSPDGAEVFVTGTQEGVRSPGDEDYATVALDSSSGAELWATAYNGPGEPSWDTAVALAVSPAGNAVYVTGSSVQADAKYEDSDFATIAYAAR